jgi:SAM-dependent methyltransferase
MNEVLTSFKYFPDRDSYLNWLAASPIQPVRRNTEAQVLASLAQGENLDFYCYAHQGIAQMRYEKAGRHADGYNWREFGHCNHCESITRIRLVAECIHRASLNYAAPKIYLTEQLTPLYKLLRSQYPSLFGSEFVPDISQRLQANLRLKSYLADPTASIRHEDCCALEFTDDSVHVIGTFDVLEHIPDYRTALSEFFRVLAPGGQLFLTAPFLPASERTLVRAKLTENPTAPIEHLQPPEYHGNPTDPEGGALCFYHFGWDLLDALRKEGFRAVALLEAWGEETATFGNQQVIIATK